MFKLRFISCISTTVFFCFCFPSFVISITENFTSVSDFILVVAEPVLPPRWRLTNLPLPLSPPNYCCSTTCCTTRTCDSRRVPTPPCWQDLPRRMPRTSSQNYQSSTSCSRHRNTNIITVVRSKISGDRVFVHLTLLCKLIFQLAQQQT